jgi:phage terminase small subunit
LKRNNNKVRRFIAEYLKDQNGTQAAIRAGYSKRTAQEQSSDLLSKPMVKKRIETALRKAEERAEVSIAETLRKISILADSDIRELFNENGSLKPIKQWPDKIALAVSSVEIDELDETKKVKLWDKVKALEMMGRHLKMFTDKVEHSFDEEFLERLNRGEKRSDEFQKS